MRMFHYYSSVYMIISPLCIVNKYRVQKNLSKNEEKKANQRANKRIIHWPPFWNKVYSVVKVTAIGITTSTRTKCVIH